ncbi:MAG: hypothetical protein MJE66_12610 [Proteobacteria bacterium]|nr:hypothetical protein [Pseudomonadota bacterium]
MSESPAFAFVCQELESRTSLDRLEARGTVRLALKAAGLEARSVSRDQMAVVVEKVLPGELTARGIDAVESLCREVAQGLAQVTDADTGDSPDAVFSRLGGS